MAIEVTQRVEFECCYIVNDELNAHRYRFEVTVNGPQREQDMGAVIDFRQLRNYMDTVCFDRKFLYSSQDMNTVVVGVANALPDKFKERVDFLLSAENICKELVNRIQFILDRIEPGVTVISAKLRENSESFASWSR